MDGQIVLWFGKYFGQSLDEIAWRDPGYLEWLLGQDFLSGFKARSQMRFRAQLEAVAGKTRGGKRGPQRRCAVAPRELVA
jgi:hypothetical protein